MAMAQPEATGPQGGQSLLNGGISLSTSLTCHRLTPPSIFAFQMQEGMNDIINSFALAFVLYLTVEAPTRTLAKLLLVTRK